MLILLEGLDLQCAQAAQAPAVGVVVGDLTVAETKAIEGEIEVDSLPAMGAVSPGYLAAQEFIVGLGYKVVDAAEVIGTSQIHQWVADQCQRAEIYDGRQESPFVTQDIPREVVSVDQAFWRPRGQTAEIPVEPFHDPIHIGQVILKIRILVGEGCLDSRLQITRPSFRGNLFM